jgi:hypothetical protein
MSEHAKFSPSKMERIIECAGSLALEETCPDSVSKYAAEGTAAHQLAQWALTDGKFYTRAYQGRIIEVIEKKGTPKEERFEFEADEDMCEHVQNYVDDIVARIDAFKLQGATVELLVEQRIDISRMIGVPDQFGTADCVLVVTFPNGKTLLVVIDLKYGMGVEVVAEENKQAMTYALGALDEHSLANDIDRVLIVINMPRLDHVTEWEIGVDILLTFRDQLQAGATKALEQIEVLRAGRDARKLDLKYGDKHCRFCKARGKCPEYAVKSLGPVMKFAGASLDSFDDLTALDGQIVATVNAAVTKLDESDIGDAVGIDGIVTRGQLAELMNSADALDDFLNAVRARVRAEIEAALNVPGIIPGWMLAEGRRGHRAWKNTVAAEDTMKSFRLKSDDMYTRKLISPTAAEKLLKESARRWTKLKELIFQPAGNPSVVRDNDPKKKRLVVKPAIDAFDNLEDEFADLA